VEKTSNGSPGWVLCQMHLMFQENDSDLQVHRWLTGFFMRRLESTQWITKIILQCIGSHFARNECSLQRAQLQAGEGTCLSGSKNRHILRPKNDSAFATFDKLYDSGQQMQRRKAALCNCYRWQRQDDRIKTHIRTSRRP